MNDYENPVLSGILPGGELPESEESAVFEKAVIDGTGEDGGTVKLCDVWLTRARDFVVDYKRPGAKDDPRVTELIERAKTDMATHYDAKFAASELTYAVTVYACIETDAGETAMLAYTTDRSGVTDDDFVSGVLATVAQAYTDSGYDVARVFPVTAKTYDEYVAKRGPDAVTRLTWDDSGKQD